MGGVPDEVGALEPAAEVCILGVPIGSFFLALLRIARPSDCESNFAKMRFNGRKSPEEHN